jgi:phosphoserine aminotransferase
MAIPSNYRVLFLQGGATQHFAQIPMNFARPDQVANYVVSGAWGEKAVREAKPYVQARISASSLDSGYTRIPPRAGWDLHANAAYVHYTPNETIHGVEFQEIPEVGEIPLVADMSSDILSRPIDVSKFGLIYAGAQKNIGASGLVILIIREDLLERCPDNIARIFNYAEHAANHSLFNRRTPGAGTCPRWCSSGCRRKVASPPSASATGSRPNACMRPSTIPVSTRIRSAWMRARG